jgi:hypothetical protein
VKLPHEDKYDHTKARKSADYSARTGAHQQPSRSGGASGGEHSTSDPPSSIPDPATTEIVSDDVLADSSVELVEERLVGLPAGSWAALSIGDRHLIGTGASRDEASQDARRNGHTEFSLVCVAGEMEGPEDRMKKAS